MSSSPKVAEVKVSVSISDSGELNADSGELKITVDPWRVAVGPGDQVEWIPLDRADSVKIDKHGHADAWPFDEAPPHDAYTGNKQKHAKTPSGRKADLKQGDRVRYSITVWFTDTQGNDRTATIDPDMVIFP